jgi:signal transduction histidine kinase/ActR/RegA family two-component response regulator
MVVTEERRSKPRTNPRVADVLQRVGIAQLLLLLALVVVGAAGLITYGSADDRAALTEDQLLDLESLRGEVLFAETQLRGFILIGDATLRTGYASQFPKIDTLIQQLEDRADPDDRSALGEIRVVIFEWRDDYAEPILTLVDHGDFLGARDVAVTGRGEERIDEVRARVGGLRDGVLADLADRRADTDRTARFGILLVAVALGGLLFTGFIARRRLGEVIGSPLQDLARTADRLGEGDLSARTTASGAEEIERVAAAFNSMAKRMEETVTDLRAVDRLKSEFVSVVSHELRTPLTSIRGSLGLLASGAMGEMPPDAAQMLSIAVNNTDRLVRLINDILDLERIEAGRETMDIRPCRAERVINDAASSVEGAASAAGVTLEVRPVDAVLHADPDRLVQALTNLAGNAIKFSEPGTTVVIEGVVDGDDVALRVIDHGRGIPPEMLHVIFERFRQVDASDARGKGGTGLGLAITKSIVERHDGRIEVTSKVGEGSCFSIVLPRHTEQTQPKRSVRGGDVVLVVEDEADIVEILDQALRSRGFEVESATTADDAIERCRITPPAALVLDVKLAAGDGYDVVRALRLDDRLRALPTVVYTVTDLQPAQKDALRLGETVFIVKGKEREENIANEVVDLLVRRRSSAEQTAR